MWKTIVGEDDDRATSSGNEWFGIEAIAGIGVTSEADGAPLENVLYPDRESGWCAGEPGPQIIQITFAGQQTSGTFDFSSENRSSQEHRSLRCAVPLPEGSGER